MADEGGHLLGGLPVVGDDAQLVPPVQGAGPGHQDVRVGGVGQVQEGHQVEGEQQLHGPVEIGEVVLPVGQGGDGGLGQHPLHPGVVEADLVLEEEELGADVDVVQAPEGAHVDHGFPDGPDGPEVGHVPHRVFQLVREVVDAQGLGLFRPGQQLQAVPDVLVIHLVIGGGGVRRGVLLGQGAAELVGGHVVGPADGGAQGADVGKAVVVGDGGDGLVGDAHVLHRVAQAHLLQIGLEVGADDLLEQPGEVGGGEVGGLGQVIQPDVVHIIALDIGDDLPAPQGVVLALGQLGAAGDEVQGIQIIKEGVADLQLPQLPALPLLEVGQGQVGEHLAQGGVVPLVVLGGIAHQLAEAPAGALHEEVVVHEDDHQQVAAVAGDVKGSVRLHQHQAVVVEIAGLAAGLDLHLAAEDHQEAGLPVLPADAALGGQDGDILDGRMGGQVGHRRAPPERSTLILPFALQEINTVFCPFREGLPADDRRCRGKTKKSQQKLQIFNRKMPRKVLG